MTTWRWPLPNYVPWDFPRTFGSRGCSNELVIGAYISAPANHPVHAVEDGIVVASLCYSLSPSGWGIVLRGDSGLLVYEALEGTLNITVGTSIHKGQYLGTLSSNALGLFLFPEEDKNLITGQHETKLRMPSELGYFPGTHPLDPTTKLREAWTTVTPRFHRNQEKLPATPAEKKKLLCWLSDHPLWRDGVEDAPFCWMEPSLHPDLAWVDPTCECIVGECDPEDPRNTDFRVWLNPGRWFDESQEEDAEFSRPDKGWTSYNKWGWGALIDLECGGSDMQEALIQLALRVKHYYGEGFEPRKDIPGGWGCKTDLGVDCIESEDGFCKHCGYLVSPVLSDEELK